MGAIQADGSRHFGVVVVEDSRSDALLIIEGLRQEGLSLDVLLLTDGEKASDHFVDDEEVGLLPLGGPDLILLDLNLPKKGGAELIREIKANPNLREVPVVVFSGSDPSEVWRCYELGANLVVRKPQDVQPFVRTIQGIKRYCLRGAKTRRISRTGPQGAV